MQNNLTPYQHSVNREQRSSIKGHQPLVIWLTGLSGSGKSTLASLLEARLAQDYAAHTFVLDGDNLRSGLNRDLGFSDADRHENIRRVGEVARLMFDAGLIVITAFISPFRADRDAIRALLPPGGFLEVFLDCPLAECENRDPKGLYKKARECQIAYFSGIDSAYEPPSAPELVLDTASQDAETCTQAILAWLTDQAIL